MSESQHGTCHFHLPSSDVLISQFKWKPPEGCTEDVKKMSQTNKKNSVQMATVWRTASAVTKAVTFNQHTTKSVSLRYNYMVYGVHKF